jgi:hypothetical protein
VNDVSEERISTIFRVEISVSEEPAKQVAADLNMEAIHSSETSVHTRSTRRHIPEYGIIHSHRCGNLKSYNKYEKYEYEVL